MIDLAFALASVAVALGGWLAALYMRGPHASPPHWAMPFVHGVLGTASLVALILALRHGLPPTGMGTTGFAPTAGASFALAFLFGLFLARANWRGRRPNGAIVAVHASAAIAGFVILLALVALL